MSDSGKKNPLPVMVASLICDVAVQDPGSGKKNLIGIFDRLWVHKFPTQRPLSLYWKVTDAVGEYDFKLLVVHANKDDVIAELEATLTATDRLEASDHIVALPPIQFPEEGRYEFRVFMDGAYLGCSVLDAMPYPKRK